MSKKRPNLKKGGVVTPAYHMIASGDCIGIVRKIIPGTNKIPRGIEVQWVSGHLAGQRTMESEFALRRASDQEKALPAMAGLLI